MSKTILVTGSSGFIGYHVTKRLLERGDKVIGVDNLNNYYDVSLKKARNHNLVKDKNYTFFEDDVTDEESMEAIFKANKIDTICHLAAQAGVRYSLKNPLLYEQVNIRGFLIVLELAHKYSVRDIIYASSSSVYGNNTMPKNGFSEKDEVNNQVSLYGVTKRTNELMASAYHTLYGLHMTGLRFFTAYGPWGRPDMAYFSFVKAIREEKPIQVFNHGKMKRDFTYIDDVVSGIESALDKSYPLEIFNLGNSNTVLLSDFVHIIEKELNKKAHIDFQPMQPGDVLETYADISHAEKMLGYVPQTSISEGLRSFIKWYFTYYSK